MFDYMLTFIMTEAWRLVDFIASFDEGMEWYELDEILCNILADPHLNIVMLDLVLRYIPLAVNYICDFTDESIADIQTSFPIPSAVCVNG